MKFDKEKIIAKATPVAESDRNARQRRSRDRHMNVASAAIAAKVSRQLKTLGMTRVQLAEKLNVSPANITRYLSGKCNFELRTIVELERALGVHIIDREVIPSSKENKPVKVVIEYKHTFESNGSEFSAGHIDNDVFAKIMNYG